MFLSGHGDKYMYTNLSPLPTLKKGAAKKKKNQTLMHPSSLETNTHRYQEQTLLS